MAWRILPVIAGERICPRKTTPHERSASGESRRADRWRTYDLVVSTRLETPRLVLRTFEARDAGPWLALVNDPEVTRFLPPGPAPTMELAERVIGERQAMERELGHAMWAVDDKTTGTFVG
jgi:RimJ/RimL family protein N-acetyltransferase